jgi:hypothetical protein
MAPASAIQFSKPSDYKPVSYYRLYGGCASTRFPESDNALKLTNEDITKILLGLIAVFGPFAAYFAGKRQEIAVNKEKVRLDSETERRKAEAASEQADAAMVTASFTGAKSAIDSLMATGKNYQDALKEITNLSADFAKEKGETSRMISEMRANYAEEMSKLNIKVSELTTKVAILERDVATKDAALKDNEAVKAENVTLRDLCERNSRRIEDMERAGRRLRTQLLDVIGVPGQNGIDNTVMESIGESLNTIAPERRTV